TGTAGREDLLGPDPRARRPRGDRGSKENPGRPGQGLPPRASGSTTPGQRPEAPDRGRTGGPVGPRSPARAPRRLRGGAGPETRRSVPARRLTDTLRPADRAGGGPR